MHLLKTLAAALAAAALATTLLTSPAAAAESSGPRRTFTVKDAHWDAAFLNDADRRRFGGLDLHTASYKKVNKRLVVVLKTQNLTRAALDQGVEYQVFLQDRSGRSYMVTVSGAGQGAETSTERTDPSAAEHDLEGRWCANARRRFALDTDRLRISVPLNCFTVTDANNDLVPIRPGALKASARVIRLVPPYMTSVIDKTRWGKFVTMK